MSDKSHVRAACAALCGMFEKILGSEVFSDDLKCKVRPFYKNLRHAVQSQGERALERHGGRALQFMGRVVERGELR